MVTRSCGCARRRRRPTPRTPSPSHLPPLAWRRAPARGWRRPRARAGRGRPDDGAPRRTAAGTVTSHRVAFRDPMGSARDRFRRGRVLAVRLDAAVVEVGGVGMPLQATPATLAGLRRRRDRPSLPTSLVVREDSLTLFGFADADERDVFELVQTVSGVGPRLALAMLAVHTPDGAARAPSPPSDLTALTQVPGIGRKGAQRIVLELKDRLGAPTGRRPVAARAASRRPAWRDQVARRWSGSAGPPARPRTPSPRSPTRATAGERRRGRRRRHCCAPRCGTLGGPRMSERPDGTPRGSSRPRCRRAGADGDERAVEAALRPKRLDEFVGQRSGARAALARARGRPRPRPRRPTTSCCPARRASARPRSR